MSEQRSDSLSVPSLATLGVLVHPRSDVGGSVETILGWADEHGVRVVASLDDEARVGRGGGARRPC